MSSMELLKASVSHIGDAVFINCFAELLPGVNPLVGALVLGTSRWTVSKMTASKDWDPLSFCLLKKITTAGFAYGLFYAIGTPIAFKAALISLAPAIFIGLTFELYKTVPVLIKNALAIKLLIFTLARPA